MTDKLTRCDGICARCDGAGTIPDWSAGQLPCPVCKPMEQGEAVTAGAIRQSGERCEQGPVLTEHEREIRRDQAMKQLTQERDDLRRQLAQAEEREHAALAREAQMRRVVQAVRDDLDIHYEDGEVIRKARSLSFDVCESVVRILFEIPAPPVPENGPTWLRQQAAECHRLAIARGKYEGWTPDMGREQIACEAMEWLVAATMFDMSGFGIDKKHETEELGDLLATVLSIGHHRGIDVAKALERAIERNRQRAGEGAHEVK